MARSAAPAKKPRTFKFPKSMGACADRLYDTRERRLAAQRIVDEIEEEEKALKEHIISNLKKNDTGAAGRHHRVQVITDQIPRVADWRKLYDYIKRNDAFDLLQRRLNDKAVAEREEALNERLRKGAKPKLLPGTEKFTVVKVSLTKI